LDQVILRLKDVENLEFTVIARMLHMKARQPEYRYHQLKEIIKGRKKRQ